MGRKPKNPEGPRVAVTVRLPSKHLKFLDAIAARMKMSRSDAVISFLENSKRWKDQP